jgi:hypothetical protein
VTLPGYLSEFSGDYPYYPDAAIGGGSSNELVYHRLPQSSLNIA